MDNEAHPIHDMTPRPPNPTQPAGAGLGEDKAAWERITMHRGHVSSQTLSLLPLSFYPSPLSYWRCWRGEEGQSVYTDQNVWPPRRIGNAWE